MGVTKNYFFLPATRHISQMVRDRGLVTMHHLLASSDTFTGWHNL